MRPQRRRDISRRHDARDHQHQKQGREARGCAEEDDAGHGGGGDGGWEEKPGVAEERQEGGGDC